MDNGYPHQAQSQTGFGMNADNYGVDPFGQPLSYRDADAEYVMGTEGFCEEPRSVQDDSGNCMPPVAPDASIDQQSYEQQADAYRYQPYQQYPEYEGCWQYQQYPYGGYGQWYQEYQQYPFAGYDQQGYQYQYQDPYQGLSAQQNGDPYAYQHYDSPNYAAYLGVGAMAASVPLVYAAMNPGQAQALDPHMLAAQQQAQQGQQSDQDASASFSDPGDGSVVPEEGESLLQQLIDIAQNQVVPWVNRRVQHSSAKQELQEMQDMSSSGDSSTLADALGVESVETFDTGFADNLDVAGSMGESFDTGWVEEADFAGAVEGVDLAGAVEGVDLSDAAEGLAGIDIGGAIEGAFDFIGELFDW